MDANGSLVIHRDRMAGRSWPRKVRPFWEFLSGPASGLASEMVTEFPRVR
jgi:hypothetical protein